MTPYRTLDDAYQRLARRRPAPWVTAIDPDGTLESIVANIRDDTPDPSRSDQVLRSLIATGRHHPDALTVVLHALAPTLKARISSTATSEYHAAALGDLALVILDSNLNPARLAHRLVNRAHNRSWRTARRVHTRGVINVTTTVPYPHDRLGHLLDHQPAATNDIADAVADRVDLERFATAIEIAVAEGHIPAAVWAAYRNHRLRRAVSDVAVASTGRQRVAAHRAAHRLAPYIDTHLAIHAA